MRQLCIFYQIRLEVEGEAVESVNGAGDGESAPKKSRSLSYPVDLDLEWVLGSMPRKVSSEQFIC